MKKMHLLFESERKNPFFPDDVFLVSYPKSGSTWLRFIIGNYLTNNRCTFKNYHIVVPDLHQNIKIVGGIPQPRFLKSHLPFTPKYGNVIYLVRDGRDVAVSYYYHAMKYRRILETASFSDFLLKFNSGELDSFGTWNEHVKSWLNNAPKNFLVVKYENLIKFPFDRLKEILTIAGIEIREKALERALNASSFENMRNMERQEYRQCLTLAGSDPKKNFIRSGTPGEWKKYFTKEMYDNFLTVHGYALRTLGYN